MAILLSKNYSEALIAATYRDMKFRLLLGVFVKVSLCYLIYYDFGRTDSLHIMVRLVLRWRGFGGNSFANPHRR